MSSLHAVEITAADAATVAGETDAAQASGDGRSRQTPLVHRVYQRLLAQISGGEYQIDQRLPGEHELAAQFLVSRPVVREALSRLREEGLIYSRRGAGSFVRMAPEESPALGYAPVETIAGNERHRDRIDRRDHRDRGEQRRHEAGVAQPVIYQIDHRVRP